MKKYLVLWNRDWSLLSIGATSPQNTTCNIRHSPNGKYFVIRWTEKNVVGARQDDFNWLQNVYPNDPKVFDLVLQCYHPSPTRSPPQMKTTFGEGPEERRKAERIDDGTLYKFSREAYWYRPAGNSSGPLIIPMFTKMRTGSGKERNYGDDFLAYLKRLNSDPDSYKHIVSATYGPSRGIRKNGKLRLVMAVYPGPGIENLVMIKDVIGKWGVVEGFQEDRIPSMSITHESQPWLIHKVYGSNRKFTAQALKDEIFVPVMSDGRFIQMKWLERI